MSVRGVPCLEPGSGDSDGCGVSSECCSSGASDAIDTRDTLLFLAARASLTVLRFGAAFFVGEIGSSTTLSGGLKICDGSTDSDARVLLALLRLGVPVSVLVVLRRGEARVLLAGAGVNSSSSSSSCLLLATVFSMSELSSLSTTTFLRVAARRDGLSGEAADILFINLTRDVWSVRLARNDREVVDTFVHHVSRRINSGCKQTRGVFRLTRFAQTPRFLDATSPHCNRLIRDESTSLSYILPVCNAMYLLHMIVMHANQILLLRLRQHSKVQWPPPSATSMIG